MNRDKGLNQYCPGGVQDSTDCLLASQGCGSEPPVQQKGIFVPAPLTEAMQTRSSHWRRVPSHTEPRFRAEARREQPSITSAQVPPSAVRLHHSLHGQSSHTSELLPGVAASSVQGIGRSSWRTMENQRSSDPLCQNCRKSPLPVFPAQLPPQSTLP